MHGRAALESINERIAEECNSAEEDDEISEDIDGLQLVEQKESRGKAIQLSKADLAKINDTRDKEVQRVSKKYMDIWSS
jgi:hypothetical protein